MFRTTLKSLAARKLRLLTTGIAVLLGVAFITGTLILTDTLGSTFDDLFADVNAGTDAYVRSEAAFSTDAGDQRPRMDESIVDVVEAVDGVAGAEPFVRGYAQVVDEAGDPMGNPEMGAPTYGMNWMHDDGLNSFDLVTGAPPATVHDVVIDKRTADEGDFAIGDPVQVLTRAGAVDLTVAGVVRFGTTDSPGGASIALFTTEAAQRYVAQPGKIDAVAVVAERGVSETDLADRIAGELPTGVEVLTGAELTAENQSDMKDSLRFFNTFLMTFAVIALLVGSFIIYNTFSILVAQRGKENALLRAVGASRRQVLASVLIEAGIVGALASVSGLVLGVGVASGLRALMTGVGIDIPGGSMVISTGTVTTSVVAGVGVSVVAALFPARKAAAVPPVAAMRDLTVETSTRHRRRAVVGAGVVAVGAAAMAAGLFAGSGIASVGFGAVVVFLGVAMLGPVIARPLARVIGAPLPVLRGLPGSLARENAIRNPKRTSSTAAALMIGVALVGFITVLASSTKASIDHAIDRAFTGDLVIHSGAVHSGGLSPELAHRLNTLPEVDAATGMRATTVEIGGETTQLLGSDPNTIEQIFDFGSVNGSLADLGASDIAVARDVADETGVEIGETVDVRFADTGVQHLTVRAIYADDDLTGDYLAGTAAFDAHVADRFDQQVFVTLDDSVSAAVARGAVEQVTAEYPQAEIQDRTEYKAAQASQIDMMLNLMYALLALAIVIALIGIANTLALSIFERTRELGLLRAVGMTRTQLRSTVRWEAVIVAVLGTVLGLAVGLVFGWAVVTALESEGISTFVVPGGQLTTIAAIAALAGVGAAILPARRAARLDVLRAVAS